MRGRDAVYCVTCERGRSAPRRASRVMRRGSRVIYYVYERCFFVFVRFILLARLEETCVALPPINTQQPHEHDC